MALVCAALALLAAPLARAEHEADRTPVRSEQSLPRFQGKDLDGKPAGTDLLSKRRGLIFVFASNDPDADRVGALLEGIVRQARAANIGLLGVSRDGELAPTRSFVRRHGFDFPVIRDDGSISAKLRVPPGSAVLIAVDAQGGLMGAIGGLAAQSADQDAGYATELRRLLSLESQDASATPTLGVLPPAPSFSVVGLDGTSHAQLSDYKGKVLVFMFFLPTCPHCHNILKLLDRLSRELKNPDLAILPVSVADKKYVIEDMQKDMNLDFQSYIDADGKAQRAFVFGQTVPEVFVIDRQGRVVSRTTGDAGRVQALLTMSIKRELGVANPILLDKTGFSGDELCGVCHRDQHSTWLLTKHSTAYETLLEHGSDRDPECVKCHTVGFAQAGGFDLEQRQDQLRGVQCENCHGRGGPHQSPDFAKAGYEKTCLGCHDAQHSLHFVFAERLPLVSHAANAQFANLSIAEKRALLEKRAKRERQLFEPSDYVGSASCQSCHGKEHKLWSESAHARAFATLGAKNASKNTACQKCHTTGFGEPTGFPAGGANLEAVGCESCHGPGKRHVESAGKTPGTILALTDKCDTCAISLICGKCHDAANDAGFEFKVEEKLSVIRHGFRAKTKTAAQ
jgi:peroxiredoxin